MPGHKSPVLGDRALSQAGMAALAFAVTVGMVAGAGLLLMQTGSDIESSGPIISVSADAVTADNGLCCQRVRLNHQSGRSVNLTRIELVVSFPDHDKQARLRDIPTSVLDQGDYTGHHVFTLGEEGIGGVADADTDTDGTYDAGDVIEFRVAHQRVDLHSGDTVVVTVVDSETGNQLADANATVVS